MIYDIHHQTAYQYTDPVPVSHHLLRLTPRDLPHQRCLRHEVEIEPAPAVSARHRDYFGNDTTFLTVEGAHRQFTVQARSRVEVTAASPVAVETPPWETVRDLWTGDPVSPPIDAGEFCFDSPLISRRPLFSDYASASFPTGRPLLEAALDLASRIHGDFTFDPQATTVATPLEEFFKRRRGVCQDFAHFAIVCLRLIGLGARYVSGYLETIPPPGQTRLAGADASHAWISIFCPETGWLDLDPTNNLRPGERHITLAWGRDYSDVSPVRGVIVGSGEHSLKVAVDVIPVSAAAASAP